MRRKMQGLCSEHAAVKQNPRTQVGIAAPPNAEFWEY